VLRRNISLATFAGLVVGVHGLSLSAAARDLNGGARTLRSSEAAVAQWLEQNRDRPTALRAFVQRLPKGGDIHSHLSGAVYAEHYLDWAARDGYCVDPAVPTLVKPSDCGQASTHFPASELVKKTAVYDKFVNLWSTRNLPFAGRSGHDQFFQAFAGFELISSSLSRQDDMVAEVANRAASQHVFYLELMLTLKGSEVRKLGQQVAMTGDFAQMRQRLLDLGLMDLVQQGNQDLSAMNREVANTLGCGTAQAQPGCEVTVRYLQQTTRTRAPQEVFAQFVYAFELAKASDEVVGINLVAPEDNPIALRDYTLQMRMLQFLKGLDPEVKVALHAGELTLGLVPPDQLRFHIRQAVEMAGANRIGHGVAIMYENEPFQLLEAMRRKGVLVEICLTSNEVILNVANKEHPFLEYKRASVPLTLASDDEGISRIDLSNEYLLAVRRYQQTYPDLKQLARNSLEYSFLPGQSLWESAHEQRPQAGCRADRPGAAAPSAGCASFLKANPRAREQWKLETEFAAFEALPSFQASGANQAHP
jgi:adenosine deaminase/adenosine deaminase CECR1